MSVQTPISYSVNEAAAELKIGRKTMLKLIHSGAVKHKRAGTRIIIPRSALESWLESYAEAA